MYFCFLIKNSLSYIFNYSYLRTGTRRVQKRKTQTIKTSSNPDYHAKLKYNACNVMGNCSTILVLI